jgi:hypothetical protein
MGVRGGEREMGIEVAVVLGEVGGGGEVEWDTLDFGGDSFDAGRGEDDRRGGVGRD